MLNMLLAKGIYSYHSLLIKMCHSSEMEMGAHRRWRWELLGDVLHYIQYCICNQTHQKKKIDRRKSQ
mgnify:CR=1 FL=1